MNMYQFLSALEQRLHKEKEKRATDFESFVEKSDLDTLIDLDIDEQVFDYLLIKLSKKQFDSLTVDSESINYKKLILLHKALSKGLTLLKSANAQAEIDAIRSKGSGRPTKDEQREIKRLEHIQNEKTYIEFSKDKMFFNYIESLKNELGSLNKAYKKYAEELFAENGTEVQPVTIRRRFERVRAKLSK
jgi:hypothetical protein